ncbi:nuclear transport factor 2 family protein [beta proteobacterium MWH-UniP1]
MMNYDRFITAAEQLSQDTVDQLADFYAPDCEFTDPFQKVRGRDRVRDIYLEMFNQLDRPRFTNVRLLGSPNPSGSEVMIGWTFEFALGPNKPRQSIAGASLLVIDAQGLIQSHHDYWDASRLMESLPLIGRIIHWIRQKIGRPSKS